MMPSHSLGPLLPVHGVVHVPFGLIRWVPMKLDLRNVVKPDDLARVQTKLTNSLKMLRAEVAGSITRKKVPELFFQVTATAAGY